MQDAANLQRCEQQAVLRLLVFKHRPQGVKSKGTCVQKTRQWLFPV
jgi:hypothetical protein